MVNIMGKPEEYHAIVKNLKEAFIDVSREVVIKEWQGRETSVSMLVLDNVSFRMEIPNLRNTLGFIIKPDLPWAEDHFRERISGEPLNPAPSYKWWPFYKNDDMWRIDGKFSHTYPERMNTPAIKGIRYNYGNLDDLIQLLIEEPLTRQAYLPIWFPEDTGATHGERVPCSIGYLFTIRVLPNGRQIMDISYQLRSCDLIRHFKNDIYMAGRLLQYVAEEVSGNTRKDIEKGILNVTINNLHIFKGEEQFFEEYNKKKEGI